MSLINDMLRDLAEREPRSAQAAAGIQVVPHAPSPHSKSYGKGAFAMVFLAVLAGATIWMIESGSDTSAPVSRVVGVAHRVTRPHPSVPRPNPAHPIAPAPRLATANPELLLRPPGTRPQPENARSVREAKLLHGIRGMPARIEHPALEAVATPAPVEITPTAPETPARRISIDLARAESASRRGDRRRATHDLETALALNPNLEPVRLSLVQIEIERGKITYAHELLIQGIKLAPRASRARELELDWLARTGDAQAAWVLSQPGAPHPLHDHPRYLALEAALAQATEHWHAARRLYGQVSALEPDNAWAWAGLGIALDQLGRGPAALLADRKAIALGTLTSRLTNYLKRRIHALNQPTSAHEPVHRP